jgi:hypothetical protein
MENGGSPRQDGKENATGNRAIRMRQGSQLPRSTKQKENLNVPQHSNEVSKEQNNQQLTLQLLIFPFLKALSFIT